MGTIRFGELITSLDLDKYAIFGQEYFRDTIRLTMRDNAYRYYLTDVLNAIAQNTAKPYGGTYMKTSYRDIVDPQPASEEVEDTRPALEIAHDIISRMRGRRANNGRK